MNILAIDTSTEYLSIAVIKNSKVLSCRNFKHGRNMSSLIVSSIKKVLNNTGVSLKKIDCFAVGLGPGSFTGLRVGLSVVKGLAFAGKKPIVGISSLDAIAMNVKGKVKNIFVVSDARRKQVYAGIFVNNGGKVERKGAYLLTNINEVLEKICADTVIIGSGIGIYRHEIDLKLKNCSDVFIESNEKLWIPKASNVGFISENKFLNNEIENVNSLVPMYLYSNDCQVKKVLRKDKN